MRARCTHVFVVTLILLCLTHVGFTQSGDQPIPQTGWRVLYVDSDAPDCGNYGAANAFDGNPGTMWITEWCHSAPATPHEIQIDLGAYYAITGFQYLPRQDQYSSGNIRAYELEGAYCPLGRG